jgi:hypothetical protein
VAAARVHTVQAAFHSGEVSPEVDGRVDQDRYYRGCKTLENFVLRPLGGARRRPGMRYVAAAKSADKPVRVLDFVPSDTRSFVLEFGEFADEGYIRFFKDNGQLSDNPELVANGDFDLDLAGWTTSGATVWNAGRMLIPAVIGTGLQDVTVVSGTTYAVRFIVTGADGVLVRLGSTSGNGELLNTTVPPGNHVFMVSSPTTMISVRFGTALGATTDTLIDEVSVKVEGVLEIASPYLSADVAKISHAPSNDVLYLACEGYAPRKLQRTSDLNWTLSVVNFRPPATEEQPLRPAATLTLAALTGNAVGLEASAAVFLAADVDREIRFGTGRAVIVTVTDADTLVVDILDDFTSLTLTEGEWTLHGSPATAMTATKKEPVGAQTTLDTGVVAAFRAEDVGKYVRIHNGIVKITAFTDSSTVKGSILVKLAAITSTTDWTLESESWNEDDGYPTAVGFSSGDRLVWVRGQRGWASAVGDYENMGESTLDDSALSFRLNTDKVCFARDVIGATDLQILTSAAEFILTGGSDTPLAPLAIFQRSDTTYGAAQAHAFRVGPATLFIERSGRALRELAQDALTPGDRYVAADLLQLAGHLTPVGQKILEMAYQSTPDSVVWCVRSDGALLGLTYNRPENVIGWHRHLTEDGDAAVESVTVIPHPDGDRDQVWLAVRRTVDGSPVRYIEYLDDTSVFSATERRSVLNADGEMVEAVTDEEVSYGQAGLDSCIVYSGAAIALSAVTGLDHLEGKTVTVIGDGRVIGNYTVTGGVLVGASADEFETLEIGLPFVGRLVPMRPELQVQGSSQGVQKGHGEITVRAYRTSTLRIQGQDWNFRTPEDDIDAAIPLYTGDVAAGNLGWDTDGFIALEVREPLPCTVLLITSILGVGV